MRYMLVLLLVAVLLAGWWVREPPEPAMVEAIPSDVLAVVLIRELPSSLTLLRSTRVEQWAGPELPQVLQRLQKSPWFPRFRAHVRRATLIVNSLQRTDPLTYRIEFGLMIWPRPGSLGTIERLLLDRVRERFRNPQEDQIDSFLGSVIRLRGEEPGQLFLLTALGTRLFVSNSSAVFADVERAYRTPEDRLSNAKGFRRIGREIGFHRDLFLYVRGGDTLGLIPEFGYALDLEDEGFREYYFAADPSEAAPVSSE